MVDLAARPGGRRSSSLPARFHGDSIATPWPTRDETVDDPSPEAERFEAIRLAIAGYCRRTGHSRSVLGTVGRHRLGVGGGPRGGGPRARRGPRRPSAEPVLLGRIAFGCPRPRDRTRHPHRGDVHRVAACHGVRNPGSGAPRRRRRARGRWPTRTCRPVPADLLLMAISNGRGHMLLSTSNKSELAVGYSTLYGDMCGGYAPIGDLYKTEVFELSRWMNRAHSLDRLRVPADPGASIEKPPSAELRPDQRDDDSLPDYEVLDAYLRARIDATRSPRTSVRCWVWNRNWSPASNDCSRSASSSDIRRPSFPSSRPEPSVAVARCRWRRDGTRDPDNQVIEPRCSSMDCGSRQPVSLDAGCLRLIRAGLISRPPRRRDLIWRDSTERKVVFFDQVGGEVAATGAASVNVDREGRSHRPVRTGASTGRWPQTIRPSAPSYFVHQGDSPAAGLRWILSCVVVPARPASRRIPAWTTVARSGWLSTRSTVSPRRSRAAVDQIIVFDPGRSGMRSDFGRPRVAKPIERRISNANARRSWFPQTETRSTTFSSEVSRSPNHSAGIRALGEEITGQDDADPGPGLEEHLDQFAEFLGTAVDVADDRSSMSGSVLHSRFFGSNLLVRFDEMVRIMSEDAPEPRASSVLS